MRIDDSWYLRLPGLRERTAAGGIVARRDGERILIALAREGNYADPVLPKGGIEPGEEFESAARREIQEEIGISELELLAPLGSTARLNYVKNLWQTTHFFLYRTTQVHGVATDPRHHPQGLLWRSADDLADMLWPDQRELIEHNLELIRQHLR